jgi:hypothetical protein
MKKEIKSEENKPKFGRGGGRPPKEGFSKPELIQLGEEFLKWMEENDKKDIVHLSEFYSEVKGIPRTYWKENVCRRPEFRTYYEKGMDWIGKKLLKNKTLSTSYGNRFLGIYFKEVAEHELEQAKLRIDYEIEKKSELNNKNTLSPNDSNLSQLISDVKSLKGVVLNATQSQTDSEFQ